MREVEGEGAWPGYRTMVGGRQQEEPLHRCCSSGGGVQMEHLEPHHLPCYPEGEHLVEGLIRTER